MEGGSCALEAAARGRTFPGQGGLDSKGARRETAGRPASESGERDSERGGGGGGVAARWPQTTDPTTLHI